MEQRAPTEAVKIGNGRISPVAIVHRANPNVVNHLYQLPKTISSMILGKPHFKTMIYGMSRTELETLVVKVTKEANRFFYQTRYVKDPKFDAVINGIRFWGHSVSNKRATSVYSVLKDAK
ncbi:hypothetical protein VQ643_09440 [Pseudomonas sp. F1_0610]|uniref:hypothetical protein n=1 Tax=Pseudomonas sp. F1_0610 TaxID=3114284 RepID=UPI0039C3D673